MIPLAYLLALLTILGEKLTQVSRVNQYVTSAQTAYARHDFTTAIFYYHYLRDSLQIRDREIKLNLAHAYFQANNQPQAFRTYQPLLTKTPLDVSSLVNLQLGVLVAPTDKTQALTYFKNALVLNPQNEEARYNYELLKKYLIQHPEEAAPTIPPPHPGQPRPQPAKRQKSPSAGPSENPACDRTAQVPDATQPNPNLTPPPHANPSNAAGNRPDPGHSRSGEPVTNAQQKQEAKAGTLAGDQKGVREQVSEAPPLNRRPSPGGPEESSEQDKNRQTAYERLRPAAISPEKARMLLEALREAEAQYLQQLPRPNPQKADLTKPNW